LSPLDVSPNKPVALKSKLLNASSQPSIVVDDLRTTKEKVVAPDKKVKAPEKNQ